MRLFGGGNKDKFKHRKQPDHSEPVGTIYEPEPKRDMNPPKTRRLHNEPEPESVTILKEDHDHAKLEADYTKLKLDYNKLNEHYITMVNASHKILQDNKKLEAKIDELSSVDKLDEFKKVAEKEIKNLVDKVDIERDRADKYGKQINDQLDTIKKLEVEVRGLKHDNKRLRDDNVDIKRNADIKINKYMAEFKEPEPEPEQIEGEGVNMAEPTEPPEPQKPSEPEPDKFTCKVCGQEAKTLHYLKMHVQRSKDADHQAYLEEDF